MGVGGHEYMGLWGPVLIYFSFDVSFTNLILTAMSDLYGEQYSTPELDMILDEMDHEKEVRCPACENWNIIDECDTQCMCGHCGHVFTCI